jgi:Ca2+:H+ antiporter
MEVVAVILAVLIVRMVAEDGESNWLEGAMLLMIYAILAMVFFVLPVEVPAAKHELPAKVSLAVPVDELQSFSLCSISASG